MYKERPKEIWLPSLGTWYLKEADKEGDRNVNREELKSRNLDQVILG